MGVKELDGAGLTPADIYEQHEHRLASCARREISGVAVTGQYASMSQQDQTDIPDLQDESAEHPESTSMTQDVQQPPSPGVSTVDVRAEGWQSVPRLASPSPEGVDWEMLSPTQMSRAGSTPRALSVADVQDAGHAEVDDHLASDSADPSSNDAMAAAEAATASALLSGSAEMEQHHGSTPVPIPVVHAEADSDSSSEAGSDRVLSLGALLPQGFRLHQDQVHPHSEEFPLPPHPQLARLLPEGNQVPDSPLSDNNGSFANLSAPASMHSFDFASISVPGSPASQRSVHADDAEGAGMWLSPQDTAGRSVSSAHSRPASEQGMHIQHVQDMDGDADAEDISADEDDISLQASLSAASSALVAGQDQAAVADADASDSDFTFPSDDDKPAAADSRTSHDSASRTGPSAAMRGRGSSCSDEDSAEESEVAFLGGKVMSKEQEDLPPATGIYATLSGAAVATCSLANGVWRWLQDFVGRLPGLVPAQARAAVVRAVSTLRGIDRSMMLGVGLAVVGALYAGTVIHNRKLSRALHARDRDMSQLVMKVFNLQHTLQSSRSIPIVRHTSSTCSFSFAGGAVTAV